MLSLGAWGGAVAVCIEREIFPAVVLAQPHSERILGCFPHEWQSSGGTLQASCNAAVGLWAKVASLSRARGPMRFLVHRVSGTLSSSLLVLPMKKMMRGPTRVETRSAAGTAVDRCREAKV
ncbi:hypothetical protein E2986_12748 [Frieseomelitta varia]|uniref:Uncharacterized protein n=1 Tax=Frieseomelitta varia TaxID=561572 RepID=A0A833S7G0_9HYME|nr:hypothetical protein E2986_12748 [Frieseomelitta varia]